MESKRDRYILCLSGGGVKVMFAAQILERLKQTLNTPLHEVFDLMVGTSGGGVLCLYSNIFPNHSLTNIFSKENLNKWCDKSFVDKVLGKVQFSPVYDGKGKRKILQTYFQDTQLQDCKTRVAIPTVNLKSQEVQVFKSYSYNNHDNNVDVKCTENHHLLRHVADATTAAIPYFPPVQFDNNVYIDGGYACNNPILLAYTESKKLFPNDAINIVTLGNYDNQIPDEWKTDRVFYWGAVQWMNNGLFDFIMNMPNKFMQKQIQSLIKCKNFLHLQKNFVNINLDDTDQETLNTLKEQADFVFEEKMNDIIHFFNNFL